MEFLRKLLTLLALCLSVQDVYSEHCKNPAGREVDWFIVYKESKITERSRTVTTGEKYYYMDSNDQRFAKESDEVDSSTTPFARTMAQVYSQNASTSFAYIMFNDQKPASTLLEMGIDEHQEAAELLANKKAYAHTKGVIAWDNREGFFLSHSVPRYPPAANKRYEFPSTAVKNAQHMLCITLDAAGIRAITDQMNINYVEVYSKNLPNSLKSMAPSADLILRKKPNIAAPYFRERDFRSSAGQPFKSFAKGYLWNKDLWGDLISGELNRDIRYQGWRNGAGGKLASDCTGKKVENIVDLKIEGSARPHKNTKDHSKWAVSTEARGARTGWVCLGDVNRMASQFKRGGGATCIQKSGVWSEFDDIPQRLERCP